MAVLGISMVFLALLLLIIVIGIMDKVLARLGGKTAGPATTAGLASDDGVSASTAMGAGEGPEKDDLPSVALAAWGLHQRRRVSVRPAANSSRWAALARGNQLAGTRGR
jgi:Na+-transporting methylmalonyl-CoA/oxaloacetate decarboxylase gamma subunit